MAAERQVGVDPVLERIQTRLVEARRLDLRERLVGELAERRAPPERERFVQQLGRAAVLVASERPPSLAGEPAEATRVEPIGIEREAIAAPAGLDHAVAERLAEIRDVDLDRLRRGGRSALAPDRVDQAIGGDDLTALQRQHRENGARLRAPQIQRPAVFHGLERAEYSQLQASPPCDAPTLLGLRTGRKMVQVCGGFTGLQPDSAAFTPVCRKLPAVDRRR